MKKVSRKKLRKEEKFKRAMEIKELTRQRKTKRVKTFVITFLSLILCVALGFGGYKIYKNASDNGLFLRNTVALSVNDLKVNNAMYSYFYNSIYNNFVHQNSKQLSSLGLNTSKSLKNQVSYYNESETWYDYFSSRTVQKLTQVLQYASAASDAGIVLGQNEQEVIDTQIKKYKSTAKQIGEENVNFYFEKNFGKGVREEDVRRSLELSAISDLYYNNYLNNLNYSNEQIQKYYNENKNSVLAVDYISFTPKNTIKGEATKESKAAAYEIAKAKDLSDFKARIKKYIIKTDKELTLSDIDTIIGSSIIKNKTVSSVSNDYVKEWLGKSKIGDVNVFSNVEKGYYTVYFVIKPAYKQTYVTKDIRMIMLTNQTYGTAKKTKAKAYELLREVNKSSEPKKTFISLVNSYSEDISTISTQGLIEGLNKGVLASKLEKWSFDKERKPSDVAVIELQEGCQLLYFEKDNYEMYKANTIKLMKDESLSIHQMELQSKYLVSVDEKAIAKIGR